MTQLDGWARRVCVCVCSGRSWIHPSNLVHSKPNNSEQVITFCPVCHGGNSTSYVPYKSSTGCIKVIFFHLLTHGSVAEPHLDIKTYVVFATKYKPWTVASVTLHMLKDFVLNITMTKHKMLRATMQDI